MNVYLKNKQKNLFLEGKKNKWPWKLSVTGITGEPAPINQFVTKNVCVLYSCVCAHGLLACITSSA